MGGNIIPHWVKVGSLMNAAIYRNNKTVNIQLMNRLTSDYRIPARFALFWGLFVVFCCAASIHTHLKVEVNMAYTSTINGLNRNLLHSYKRHIGAEQTCELTLQDQ